MKLGLNKHNAKVAAQKVLDDSGIDFAAEMDLTVLIRSRGAYYEEKPLKGKEGEIITCDGKSFIAVNSLSQPEERRRFAALHELGHFEMHRDLRPVFSDTIETLAAWFQKGEHEFEANTFASELLLPTNALKEFTKKRKFEPRLIEEIRSRFKSSTTTAILKYAEIGSYPIFVAFLVNGRVQWFRTSDSSIYFSELDGIEPRKGSVAYEFWRNKNEKFESTGVQDIELSEWFDDSAFLNRRGYEWCFGSRKYGFSMSVIWED